MFSSQAVAETAVAEILKVLTDHFGEDFHSYARRMAEKRILERAAQLSLPDLSAYRELLLSDPAEPEALARMLRVRFSTFFRDPLQFELLGSVIVPTLLNNCQGQFRAWSAACANGEEPYSLAIILEEAMQLRDGEPTLQIFATDIAEDALAQGRRGWYSPDSLCGVTLKRIGACFVAGTCGYRIDDRLRAMVTYSRHDLLDRRTYVPPESLFGGFHLVLCRNFLMYLDSDAYLKVFDKLFRALNPGGVLMLGKAEAVPQRYAPYLERVVPFGQMYRKTP